MGKLLFLSVLGLFVIILASSSIKLVRQSEVALVERLGKFHKKMEAGLHFIIPFFDKVAFRVDLRTQRLDSDPQPVITADNVSIETDTVTFYKVTDSFKSVYEIEDLDGAIQNITTTTLRDVIGSLELDKTLTSRDVINSKLRAELDAATDAWGVKVERVEVKNIIPPQDVRNAMESQMKAEREKRASILEAEGKKRSAILEAEGKQESQILEADGEGQSIERLAKAEKERINIIYSALKEAELDDAILNLEAISAMKELAKSDNKMLVPYESQALMGAVASIKEVASAKNK